jgi:Spy/CpxP family protein refolding chaperone
MSGKLGNPLRILLIVSLAINLFVGGAVAAAAIVGSGWFGQVFGFGHHPVRITGMPSPRQLRAMLDESDQAILEEMLETRRAAFRENLEAMFAAREAAAQAVAAEPFDRDRVEAAFADLRAREAAVALAAQGAVLDLVAQLGPEGRAKVAELMKRRHRSRDR